MNLSWFFTTAGVGGIVVSVLLLSAAAIYFGLIRWILRGGEEERPPGERMGWPFE